MEDKFIYPHDDLDTYTNIDTDRISDLFFIKNYKVCWVTGLIDLDNFTTIPVGYRPNIDVFFTSCSLSNKYRFTICNGSHIWIYNSWK